MVVAGVPPAWAAWTTSPFFPPTPGAGAHAPAPIFVWSPGPGPDGAAGKGTPASCCENAAPRADANRADGAEARERRPPASCCEDATPRGNPRGPDGAGRKGTPTSGRHARERETCANDVGLCPRECRNTFHAGGVNGPTRSCGFLPVGASHRRRGRRAAKPAHPAAACLVIGDGLRPGGRGAPAGQGGEVFVGRRRSVGLTPWHCPISNQFQSGGCEATKVGEIRCREARPIMDCCSRDQAVGE